jgi:hypothetical protein
MIPTWRSARNVSRSCFVIASDTVPLPAVIATTVVPSN